MSEEAKKNLIEWVKDILIAVVVAVVVLQFIMPTVVHEHSMENTLHEKDYIFVSRKAYTWFGEPERGDIIVFQSGIQDSNGKNKLLVKRIAALPGDTVYIADEHLYVNGERQDESFTKDQYTGGSMAEVTVPEGCIFAMGDNRLNSLDSRDSRVGFVKIEDIKGKAVLRLFPLSSFGSLYD